MKKFVMLLVALSLLAMGLGAAATVSQANSQATAVTTVRGVCTKAHPCTAEECALVGAHGDDCLPPQTTTVVTTTTTSSGCANGAGKDGQPGNDDCATTTTKTEPSPPVTSSTTTTVPETTTAETTTSVTTTTPTESTIRGDRPLTKSTPKAQSSSELPNTGLGLLLVVLVGIALIVGGLKLRRTS